METPPLGSIPDKSRCITVVYNLAEPEGWDAALRARKACGEQYSDLEVLDPDHIVIVFHPSATLESP